MDTPAVRSIREVIRQPAAALWYADVRGLVTTVTPCVARLDDVVLSEFELERMQQLWRAAVASGQPFEATYHARAGNDALRTFRISAVPLIDADGMAASWTGTLVPVADDTVAEGPFLSAVSVALSSRDATATVNRLVQAAVEHFCDCCAVFLLDERGMLRLVGADWKDPHRRAHAQHGLEAALGVPGGPVAVAMRAAEPLLFAQSAGDGARASAAFLQTVEADSAIVVPLVIGNGCIGALTFMEAGGRDAFGPTDFDLSLVVGRQLATALENAQSLERERRMTERFRFLARATHQLFETLSPSAMLQLLAEAVAKEFADWVLALSIGNGALHVIAAAASPGAERQPERLHGERILSEAVEREVIASMCGHRAMLIHETEREGIFRKETFSFSGEGQSRTWLVAPLYIGDQSFGVVMCGAAERRYEGADLELLEEIGRRASLALEHAESFARERRLKQTLQQATLPSHLAKVPGASTSAVYVPAAREEQVGGDWYDVFDVDEHRVLVTIGDVTGHGLEASVIMGKLRHALNAVAMYEANPARLIDVAEQIVLRRYPNAVATAAVAVIDSRARTLTYANAGHPHPLIRMRNGTIRELAAQGLPIGLRYLDEPAQPKRTSLDEAALLVFYTDGLTEAHRNPAEGQARLLEAAAKDAILHVRSPADFVNAYCLQGPAPDDVALLALNYVVEDRWTFDSGDRVAVREARTHFLARLRDWYGERCDPDAAELIFGELTANVARHAPGSVDVALERRGEEAVLHVIDRGNGHMLLGLGRVHLFAETGRGLWLVDRLGRELKIETLPGYGTHVSVVLAVEDRARLSVAG